MSDTGQVIPVVTTTLVEAVLAAAVVVATILLRRDRSRVLISRLESLMSLDVEVTTGHSQEP